MPTERERLIAAGEFAEEDLQELRIALVMTGGVSLAVWMGGVAHELSRLIRAEDATYLELLRLTRTQPRIDVIAGTSAGGLNGALLAYAITQDSGVARLRDLWLELGSLERLLRRPTAADPPSLMRGDDYFLPEIARAIGQLKNRLTDPGEVPMELIVTTTLLSAWPRGVPDSFGTILQDADHRAEFRFRRGAGLAADQFATNGIEDRLALAARCTAAFPIAFEAAYVPVGAPPDMADHANFNQSRFVLDGGILLNQPLRPALRAIFRQPASKQVRRVLAYVVPDPGEAVRLEPDDPAAVPTLADIGLASLIRMPRNQSVSAELDELTQHNLRVDAQRRRRRLIAVDLDVDDLAAQSYRQYRGFRADRLADFLFGLLARGFAALELTDRAFTGEAPLAERERLRAGLIAHLESLPPDEFPAPGASSADWFTTLAGAEHAVNVLLDLLRSGLGVTEPGDPASEAARRELQELRRQVCEELTEAQAARTPLTRDEELALARAAVAALREDRLGAWTDRELPRMLGDPAQLRPIVERVAGLLEPSAAAVQRACESPPPHLRRRAEEVAAFAAGLARGVSGPAAALRRLLALEVVQLALGGDPIVEQRVDLIQVSADAGNGLDPRERAEDKLAGLQLAHFGAFYKRSWRANDWMWGRLDAAQRLAQVLLEPARLRQLGYGAAGALKAIQEIAFGGLPEEDERVLRSATPRPWNAATAQEELAFLDDEAATPPATLPMCAQAVARRLQLGILREELPTVAKAIAWDERDGGRVDAAAARFAADVAAAPDPLPAKTAVELFGGCAVGQQRIADETGSDLLARTSTRTAAVTTAAASGTSSGLPRRVRPLLRSVRGLALMVYLVVRHALERHRAGAMLVTGAFFAGAALVGVGLLVDIPGILMVLGLGALLGAVVLASRRGELRAALGGLAAGLAVAAAPRAFIWIWDLFDDDEGRAGEVADFVERIEPVVVVGGLLLAALVLGRVSVEWPEPTRD
jgi:patatin-related protein